MGKSRVFHPKSGNKLTQQHFADASDINKIVDRFNRTGLLGGPGRPSGRVPEFLNLTGDSFHEMLIRVEQARGAFNGLPAKIRRRFSNNPENLLRFIGDDKNIEEAIEMGFISKEDLSPERKQQLNLVDEAERIDRRAFEEWKARREPFVDPDANPMPTDSDPEANPRKSRKSRTS